MNIHAHTLPHPAALHPYAPAFAHLHDLRRRIDETLQAMVDTLDAIDAPLTDREPEVDDEDGHDREEDESERECDLGSLETLDQRQWADGREPQPMRPALPQPLPDLARRWRVLFEGRPKPGASPTTFSKFCQRRESAARLALIDRPAVSDAEVTLRLECLYRLAGGLDGIDAEIEADTVLGAADIRTFALRIVADILGLSTDIKPLVGGAAAKEAAHV